MKTFCLRVASAALLLAPVAAFAAMPGPWTGPYVGVQAGLNRTSLSDFKLPGGATASVSTENAFTLGLRAGYNVQLSDHFAIGGDVFYEWNQDKDHQVCTPGFGCPNTNMGSNVYGVDALFGFPVGFANNFMPYVKIGYGHLDVTGDNVSGSDNDWRYGAGIEWVIGDSLGLIFQYTYAKYGDDVGDWENSNFTLGVNFHF